MAKSAQSAPKQGLYSIRDAGDFLGVSEVTVRRMVKRGDLVCVRIGRRIMIPTEAISRFIRRQMRAESRRRSQRR